MTDSTYNILIYMLRKALEKDRINQRALNRAIDELVLLKYRPDVS